MYFDVNASYGPWPFAAIGCETLSELDAHLARHRIEKALVSPLKTIFLPDPDPVNRELIEGCRSYPRLIPVPTLNPNLATCLDNLKDYLQSNSGLQAVKLYPNFHHYALASKRCRQIVEYLESRALPLVVNFRMEDERLLYRGLTLRPVSMKQMIALAERFPNLPLIAVGLYFDEIRELCQAIPRLRFDMSFADGHRLLPKLLEVAKPEQLLFGSHTPLMVTEANTKKLELAPIPDALKRQIAFDNAAACLSP